MKTNYLNLLSAQALSRFQHSISNRNPRVFEELSAPKIGDRVMEISTFRYMPAKDRIGFLMGIEMPFDAGNLFQRKYEIKTVDGRYLTWVNCRFIKIIPEDAEMALKESEKT